MPVNLTGVGTSYVVPGTLIEIKFGVGPSGGQDAVRPVLIIGNKTSAGSGTPDTVVYGPNSTPPLNTEADVIALAGSGSEAHREYRRFVAVNKSTPVYMIFPTASGGTAASLVITLTVTATAGGTIRWFNGSEFVDVTINPGDSPTVVAAASVLAINGQTNWPFTAGNSAGVVTLTAKIAGPRGNEIRGRAVIVSGTPATSSDVPTSTAFTSGATADSWTAALATILPSRYYYIVSPSNDVAGTTFDDLLAQVTSQALPVSGIRQLVVAGHVGTQSAASTIAATSSVNSARCRIVWQEASEWASGEIAATYAGAKALFDLTDPTYNFDGFGSTPDTQAFWPVPPQSQSSKWPTSGPAGSINAALNNGLTPVAALTGGTGSYVVMDVTTKHKNGSAFDYRNRDGHITTECDFFADDCVTMYQQRFVTGKKLVQDPPVGATIQDGSIVHPSIIAAGIANLINKHDDLGRLKNVATIKAGLSVQVDPNVPTRSTAQIPLQVVNLHHQGLIELDDVSSSLT